MIELTGGRELSEKEIRAVEADLAVALPEDYRRFVALHDGARPALNLFKVAEDNDSGVNEFIPLSRIRAEALLVENLPDGHVPIAWAEGGNYLCLDISRKQGVFFWDHEDPSEYRKLADSFSDFIVMIEPLDPDSIDLDFGQVKSAWIDPDFLDSLRRK